MKKITKKDLLHYYEVDETLNRIKTQIRNICSAGLGFAPSESQIDITEITYNDEGDFDKIYFDVREEVYLDHIIGNTIGYMYDGKYIYRRTFNKQATCEEELFVFKQWF